MVTSAVQLDEGCYPQDLRSWYDGADVGESITVALSSRATAVRLIKRPKHYVSWWPMGGRGMTMTLEDAMRWLDMLRDRKPGLKRPATRTVQSPGRNMSAEVGSAPCTCPPRDETLGRVD